MWDVRSVMWDCTAFLEMIYPTSHIRPQIVSRFGFVFLSYRFVSGLFMAFLALTFQQPQGPSGGFLLGGLFGGS